MHTTNDLYPDIVHMSISIVTRVCLALSHSFAVFDQINPTYLIQLRISSCRPLPLQSPNVSFFFFSNMYSQQVFISRIHHFWLFQVFINRGGGRSAGVGVGRVGQEDRQPGVESHSPWFSQLHCQLHDCRKAGLSTHTLNSGSCVVLWT